MKEGLFWVIARNKKEIDVGKFEIIAHFDGNANHVDVWERVQIKRKDFQNIEYDYFPRGRIWIANGETIVFINQVLRNSKVVAKICEIFELDDSIKLHNDGCGIPWK